MPKTTTEIEEMVETAIAKLESGYGEWVILTRLRDELGESVNRHQLDEVLREMGRGGYNIVPESNQEMLTDADREAAVWIGGQWKHLICRGQ